jgi:hemin uptake protein HemP
VTEASSSGKEPAASDTPELIVDAQKIFQGRKEIVIEHEGVRYRLRLTRRNKLILQK